MARPATGRVSTSVYLSPGAYQRAKDLANFRVAKGEKTSAGEIVDTALHQYFELHQEELAEMDRFRGR